MRRHRGRARARSRTARGLRWLALRAAIVGLIALLGYVAYLDHRLRRHFDGARWALPAHVYARPLELYPGLALSKADFVAHLTERGYRAVSAVAESGTFASAAGRVQVYTRPFTYWDGRQPALRLTVRFDQGRVAVVQRARGQQLPIVRIEPRLIGSISPVHHEDRILVKLDDVPQSLIAALLIMEDRNFLTHWGIDPRGIARALLADLRAGAVVQGGSTLTQQLVKNMFLSQQRTLSRKLVEAIMAVLLEIHYNKREILDAYLNEVFLGQAGKRAIHGFGLASQFYFGRPLQELKLQEAALLVGLVRAPSYYNPRRHPKRALIRRNLVLSELVRSGYIPAATAAAAARLPLGIASDAALATNEFAAFGDYVHRQLRAQYRDNDLRSAGLAIFTTLDPGVQRAGERALAEQLRRFEARKGLPHGTLQGAVVVARVTDGEVVAMVGDRQRGYAGFNRALDARRPVGSLIKPAVYLAALEHPDSFTLATLVDDSPLTVKQAGAPAWRPQNYDRRSHGEVLLENALVHSYNVPTVRIGLKVGVNAVLDVLRRLGIERALSPYPSLFLGAAELTPVEMTQMYQTLAAGGFRAPLRSILSVLSQDNRPLTRYGLNVEQSVQPTPAYLINAALRQVTARGTAAAVDRRFSPGLGLAGKTGTTDNYRDSWFAGYAGNYVAVVWVGRDDNRPVGLSGASGALKVWMDLMARLDPTPVNMARPAAVIDAQIDPASGLLADRDCAGELEMPFAAGSAPQTYASCASGAVVVMPAAAGARQPAAVGATISGWFKRLFRRQDTQHASESALPRRYQRSPATEK